MAKKKTERKPTIVKGKFNWQDFLRSERTDFLVGMIVVVFALYTFVAMFSFLSTGAADQSILDGLRPGEWLNKGRIFKNYCGSLGAMMSYWFMARNFGYAAFFIPSFLFLAGIKMMQICTVNLKKWFFGIFVAMIWLSIFLSKVFTPLMPDAMFNPGGWHGVVTVSYIENLIGPPGLTAVLFFSAVAYLTFVSKQTITWVRRIFNPLKTITNKAGDIMNDHLNVRRSETELANGEYNGASENVDDDDNNARNTTTIFKAPQAKTESDAQSQVVDLTEFSDLDSSKSGDQQQKTPYASTAGNNSARTQSTKPLGGSNLTIEVGKDEKTSNSNLASSSVNTLINPLEPFTSYKRPSLELLSKDENDGNSYIDKEEIKAHNEEIVRVLKSFGIEIGNVKATVGPTITLYEITPAEGIRITKIRNLEDDIALRLSALGVRIIAPIPGKGTIGIEVPNKKRHNVSMESILKSKKFQETKYDLPIALGKTITNEVFMADLTKIPHLLVAGATGQGKSVGLNVIITSLLYKKHPNELKLVLIDPKKVEFSVYSPIADHFMAQVDDDDEPIITDVTKVVRTLKSLCTLMDHRYDLLKLAGARNIKEYNEKFLNRRLNPERGHEFMPYIVVIIDEFGDLIMTAGKEVEMPIARIAQLARAVGIHMIIATQRPTTSIITGNIKANFPGRIAFKVSSMMDSRIILDRPGANQLIGMGDMLYLNGNEPTRVQCAFISTQEIGDVNDFIARQPGPQHPMELPEPKSDDDGGTGNSGTTDLSSLDPFFEEAARSVIVSQQGSTSMIQRRFSIGYNRAGRLMDQLEKAGIVGAAHGSKPRDVLIADENQLAAIMAQLK